MPITPDAETNFFLGLSDFWTRYFLDTKQIQTIYDAAQTLIGQQYLDLLSDVLAVSLKDAPLFSKRYYHFLPFREDQITYVEGPSTGEDRWVFQPAEKLARANVMMNRVLSPTSVLECGRDYDISDGAVLFKGNPFQVFSSPLPGFAVRNIPVLYDYTFALNSVLDWAEEDVASGDILRIYPNAALPYEFTIRLVDTKLGLARGSRLPSGDLRSSGFRYVILRKPFDTKQTNAPVAQPTLVLDGTSDSATVAGTWQVRKLSGGENYRTFDLAGKYVWVTDGNVTENQGLYRIRRVLDADTLEVDRPTPFVESSTTFKVVIYDYGYTPETAPAKPKLVLPHKYLVEGSLKLNGVRAVSVDTNNLAGGALEEGLDYLVNYDEGFATCLVPLEVGVETSANYEWLLDTKQDVIVRARNWRNGELYTENTPITAPNGDYAYASDTHFSGSSYYSDATHWRPYEQPLVEQDVIQTRELSAWVPDAEVDEERLYNNFGFLLGVRQPSSENYRALLEGLSQLFLLGPSFDHIEAALNVMAGYPLVREDGEIVKEIDTGVIASGVAGRIEDVQFGRNGVLSTAGTFTVTGGNFQTDDALNSTVRIVRSLYNNFAFTVSSVTNANTVVLNPAPFVDESNTGFYWTHEHAVARKRFSSTEHTFSVADIGGYISITSETNQKNLGSYRIDDFVNAHAVILESAPGFYDESALSWQLTRTNEQRVTTNLRTYRIPLGISLVDLEVGQTLNAFTRLTDAFAVIDYIVTPTWWHGQVIPGNLLELVSNDAGRRHATPVLIRNEVNAVDGARIGDPGLIVGADDEGRPAIARNAEARWTGSDFLVFNTPEVTVEDIGQYINITQTPSDAWLPNTAYILDDRVHHGGVEYRCTTAHTSGGTFNGLMWTGYKINLFVGSYRIASVTVDGTRVTLDDFPTPAMIAEGAIPDGTRLLMADVALPARLYRRTVGFVIMDKFLKYHTMQVKINTYSGLSPEFITTIAETLSEARPNYTYLFVNPIAQFREEITISDTLSVLVT